MFKLCLQIRPLWNQTKLLPKLFNHGLVKNRGRRQFTVSCVRFETDLIKQSTNLPYDYAEYNVPLNTIEASLKWIAESSVVQGFENSLIYIHDLTHLPWYGTIILCTLVLRFCVITPLLLHQNSVAVKCGPLYFNLSLFKNELKTGLRKLAKDNKDWDASVANKFCETAVHQKEKELRRRLNAPSKYRVIFLPYVQIPIWVTMMISLRHLTFDYTFFGATDLQMQIYNCLGVEGTLWFSNLCMPDPYFILPLIICAANITALNLNVSKESNPEIVTLIRFLNVAILPVMCTLPAAPVLYAATSSIYALLQAIFLRNYFQQILKYFF